MTEERKLVGLKWSGDHVWAARKGEELAIIVENGSVLGIRLNHFCTSRLPEVPNEPGDELIDIVLGDPYLLRNVKVVARGLIADVDMPDDVREAFWYEETDLEIFQYVIVFETENGSLVYANAALTTLFKKAKHLIDKRFLS